MNKITFIIIHVLGCMFYAGLAAFSQSETNSEIRNLLLQEYYEKVIERTNEKLALDSNLLDLYFYQALAYRENYQFEKSIESCKKGISKGKTEQDITLLLAKNYVALYKYAEALRIYENEYKTDTNNIQVKIQLAKLYQAENQYDKAIMLYANLVSRDSLNSYFYKQLGLCLLEVNDTSALRVLEKAVKLNPNDIALAIKLANKYNDMHYYFKSIAIINFILNYNKESYHLYKVLAYTHFLVKNNDLAAKNFEKVLELGDTTQFTLKYLGYAYYELEDYEKAYQTLESFLNIDTTDTRVYFHLSIAARKLYKTKESIAFMEKSFNLLMPSNKMMTLYYMQAAENYITHGARCKIDGKFNEEKQAYYSAIDNYKLAFSADETNTHALYQIGVTYDNYLNEKIKALAFYNEYSKTLSPYLQESDEQFATRIAFIKDRIQKIREDLHFDDELDD